MRYIESNACHFTVSHSPFAMKIDNQQFYPFIIVRLRRTGILVRRWWQENRMEILPENGIHMLTHYIL